MMQGEAQEFELTIDTLVYGGEGMGRLPDGRAAFVPFVLPGERVRMRAVEAKRGFVRGDLVEVIEPSPQRISPRCVHFGLCGGCHYQDLPYPAQLAAKRAILQDQLVRIGKIVDPPVGPTVASPVEYNYRNHVQFHQDPDGKLGYVTFSGERVFAIQECHLPEAALNETWPLLDFEPLPEVDRIGLRLGADDDVMLTLESEGDFPPELSLDLPISAAFVGPAGTVILAGDESLLMEVKGRPFRVSPGAFFQVNTGMAGKMVDTLLERLPLTEKTTVLDVYCGVGLFSAFLAPRVGQVVGIELSEPACADFAANLDEFDNVALYQGAAEEVLPGLDLRPDVVIVDPPRSGLERRALDALVKAGAPTLAYVSCDPATLARDIRRLADGGYHLDQAIPFDLFPQTYHIETIALMTKQA
jgi:23S rRNA (uracil1939-C5)-methyltransferase